MKLFYLLQLPKKLKLFGKKEFHTSEQHKHDQEEGCEFLDESIHMNEESFEESEQFDYQMPEIPKM